MKILFTKELVQEQQKLGKNGKQIAKWFNINYRIFLIHAKKLGVILPRFNPNLKKLEGKKFNRWTVLEKSKTKIRNGTTLWKCQCECGTIKDVRSCALTGQSSKSCGCFHKEVIRKGRYDCGELEWSHFGKIRSVALRVGREFTITIEYAWELYLKQNKKCALTSLPIDFGTKNPNRLRRDNITASLDRIDSSKGYIEGNVQWVHKHINSMKLDHDQKYFIELCSLVCKNFNGEKNVK